MLKYGTRMTVAREGVKRVSAKDFEDQRGEAEWK